MVFNATFNNISVISWRSVLLVEETRVPWENHRPAASHWQTLYHIMLYRVHIIWHWTHDTSLAPPLFIEMPVVQIQESERSCICVRGIDFVSTSFLLDFGTVSTEWYFLIFILLYYIILHYCMWLSNKKKQQPKDKLKLKQLEILNEWYDSITTLFRELWLCSFTDHR